MPDQTIQAKVLIGIAETFAGGLVESWEISDEFGSLSRQFSLSATEIHNLQPGNAVRIEAGYDFSHVTLIDGIIDDTSLSVDPLDDKVAATGRDEKTIELQALVINRVWTSVPPKSMPRAHQVIREAAEIVGIRIGVLEFPDYDLYATFHALGQTVPQIIATLAEPFNQFARLQYVTQIRNGVLSVVKVNWTAPAAGGTQLTRHQHATQTRKQTLYLEQPRLNEVERIIIRGASWTTPKLDLGLTTQIEYFRNTTTEEVSQTLRGQVTAPGDAIVSGAPDAAFTLQVVTEETITSLLYGDKVLEREHEIMKNDELVSRTRDRFWYYEPDTLHFDIVPTGDVDTFIVQSLSPSETALLHMVHSKTEAFVDIDGVKVFRERSREIVEYQYDEDGNVACENKATQEFLPEEGRWDVAEHTSRTHSQITGGAVQTTRQNFIFEDSKFVLDQSDRQLIGGTRPRLNDGPARRALITHQAQAPQGELDEEFQPIDFGEGFLTWQYESPYIGQAVCDQVYQLALDEREFQRQGYRWEELPFDGILNPNLWVGQSVSVEIAEGEFRDYIVQTVSHRFGTDQALTSGSARRLTQEEL